jgi:hypothetical protein
VGASLLFGGVFESTRNVVEEDGEGTYLGSSGSVLSSATGYELCVAVL